MTVEHEDLSASDDVPGRASSPPAPTSTAPTSTAQTSTAQASTAQASTAPTTATAPTTPAPTTPAPTAPSPQVARRKQVGALIRRLVAAIRSGDDAEVERVIVELSQMHRWLAPLALIVGAFLMLFHGIKVLVTNWRLFLVQVLPAMWIWLALIDIKAHVLRGRQFHVVTGPVLIPFVLAVTALTAASFFLNAVFAYAIAEPREPKIGPAFGQARRHLGLIVAWGCGVGLALSFSSLIATRWGHWPFVISQSIVVGVMMFCYLAVPARLVGIQKTGSRRDTLAASALGGAVGAVVTSPPYLLGRFGILMLGWHYVFWLGIILIVIGATLQAGTTSAVRAVKFSTKLLGNPSATTR